MGWLVSTVTPGELELLMVDDTRLTTRLESTSWSCGSGRSLSGEEAIMIVDVLTGPPSAAQTSIYGRRIYRRWAFRNTGSRIPPGLVHWDTQRRDASDYQPAVE